MIDFQGFYPRMAEEKIWRWLNLGYIVALLGARQTGKTTLLQKIAKTQKTPCFYYSFDDLLVRNKIASDFYFLKKDIEARLGLSLENLDREIFLLLDEAQKEPSIFELVKILHDNFPQKIKIVISGSASLEIQKKASESLAGRAQYLYLFPFSLGEIIKAKFGVKDQSLFDLLFEKKLDYNLLRQLQSALYAHKQELDLLLNQILVFGLLPGVWRKRNEERFDYLRSVVSLYLEKDIRGAGLVRELENFQNILETVSFQVGGILNLANLSTQTQVSVNTLRHYRSILKNTFVLNFLFPFIQTPQKRYVKSPKVYFYDIGMANFLAGRARIENVLDSKASGGIFENIFVKSFEAYAKNETLPVRTFYFRDYQEKEVDLIIKKENRVIPIEITNSENLLPRKITSIKYFLDLYKEADFGLIIYRGELKQIEVGDNRRLICLPWWLWR